MRALLLAAAAVPASYAQFQLYLVNGTIEQPLAPVYDLGNVEPGLSASPQFRIRNITGATAILNLLAVRGAGFSLTAGPALPATLAPQKSVDFTVLFQSAGTGNYSASLDLVGISVLLTATVPVELTCLLGSGTGAPPLGAAPVDFGNVERGSAATRHVLVVNQTNVPLTAPAIATTGAGFAVSGATPSGILLQPAQSAGLDLQFSPAAAGPANGLLAIGSRSYILRGTGVEPSLPAPRLAVSLVQAQSAQQGAITVNLDAPSKTSGSGTVTIAFQAVIAGAADPAIAFASGGLTAVFTVTSGDTQGHFGTQATAPFQTGTTAGTLTITVDLGGLTDRQTVTIAPAAVGVTAAQGVRSAGAVEVDLTGFDNTRTAGQLAFTFFDAAGNAIAPGAIRADSTTTFASYFQTSAGGSFALKAVFPVSGDASQIKAFEAAVTNSAGTAKTARTSF